MNCHLGEIGKKIHGVPCFPALVIVISCILSGTESCLFLILSLVTLVCVCLIKAWRLALLSLLLGICSWGITGYELRHDEKNASFYGSADGVLIETCGSVMRSFPRSAWLKCDTPATTMEVILPEGAMMRTGERWKIRGLASSIPCAKTPGAFDRRQWLARNRVTARLSPIDMVVLGKGNAWSRLLATAESWRDRAAVILSKGSEPGDPRTGIMASLLLGDKRAMDTETLQIFQEGGCLHIFAVSGMHVGFAAGIFFFFFSFFRLSPIATRLLTLLPLALYVFVTGMPISAMRAFVMVCLFFLGTAMRRKTHAMNLLALTGIIFLIREPFQLYDAGFLLSFLIFAAVVISGSWESTRPAWWAPDPFIPRRIYTWRERMGVRFDLQARLAVVVSIICWIVAIPVTIGCFGTFNLYAAALNIAIVPLVPVVMFSCMASVMLFWCTPALLVCNAVSRWLAGILLSISGIAADQPGALFHSSLPSPPGQALLLPSPARDCPLICGNPAAVINPGDPNTVRFVVSPAIKTLGFNPSIVFNTRLSAKNTEGIKEFRKAFPHARYLPMPSQSLAPLPISPNGTITAFPPNHLLSTGIADDRCTPIVWEYKGKRLLYAEAASMHMLSHIIRQAGSIDILIMAFHAKDPANEAELLIETGASIIICLSDERHSSLPSLPKRIETWNLRESGPLLIDMEARTVTPWGKETRTR